MRKRTGAFLVGAVLLGAAVAAAAQEAYPAKPIRILVTLSAGSQVDFLARVIGQKLSESLGQQVVVENKAGAGGTLGSAAVAAAPADGYTILYNTSSLLLGSMLYKAVKFDPLKDFAPVARTAGTPPAGRACRLRPTARGAGRIRARRTAADDRRRRRSPSLMPTRRSRADGSGTRPTAYRCRRSGLRRGSRGGRARAGRSGRRSRRGRCRRPRLRPPPRGRGSSPGRRSAAAARRDPVRSP